MSNEENNHLSKLLPFHGSTCFDIGEEFETVKRRIQTLMDNHGLVNFQHEKQFLDLFYPREQVKCEYLSETELENLVKDYTLPLNIFSLNIRSLSKHGVT